MYFFFYEGDVPIRVLYDVHHVLRNLFCSQNGADALGFCFFGTSRHRVKDVTNKPLFLFFSRTECIRIL
jgi:hypothetical protein